MIFFILSFLICFILLLFAIIKLKFRFWAEQPVFHIYDLSYYFFLNGVIQKDFPDKTRYTNFKNVETLTFGKNVSPLNTTRFVQLLNRSYLRNGDNKFSPKQENVEPYFEGHNSPCFLSFYNEQEMQKIFKTDEIINVNRPIGLMTSRPMHVTLKKVTTKFDAYYADYLCVDNVYRKKGVAPQIIATHHYNQRLLNKDIQVSLFKREGTLTGIVPLCIFNMYIFSMKNWSKPSHLLPPYSIVECGALHHLYDFLRDKKEKFEVTVIPEITNFMALIKTKNIFIYLLLQDKVGVVGCYFFKKSCTTIEKGEEALICFASINDSTQDIFAHGFKQSLSEICLKKESAFYHVVVEDIGDNDVIIANLKKKTWPKTVIPAAYFFYNYAYATINKNKTLFIL